MEETIQVAGGEPVDLTVRYTRHGPIIWETTAAWKASVRGRRGRSRRTTPSPCAGRRWRQTFSFRASGGLIPGPELGRVPGGAALFDVPSQNFVYADVDGNIGYQTPGHIPIRAQGDGTPAGARLDR